MTEDSVRTGVLGPNLALLRVVEGGRGKKRGGRKPEQDDGCPLVPLGHRGGEFFFLDVAGQERKLTARQLGGRADLAGLFLGDTSWLLEKFPKRQRSTKTVNGQAVSEEITVGFYTALAAEFLMRLARGAGLYGPHVTLRQPGIWPDLALRDAEIGSPAELIVHCGDAVCIGGAWRPAGFRYGDHFWPAAPKTPRPGVLSCDASVAKKLQQSLQELWSWRQPAGAVACLGLLGVGYFGAAAPWRSNGFLAGEAGGGKSSLLAVLRALSPPHHFTNNTSAAGVEQELNGRAVPTFIDEGSDRQDRDAAQKLMDVVLSATGAEGTQGFRGGANGVARSFSLVTNIVMASINPPDMQPQHRQRFTLIELKKPGDGEDNKSAQDALVAYSRSVAASLWARALTGFQRYRSALDVYRAALLASHCDAREADQLGAILAGWWVLVEDGVPGAPEGVVGVRVLDDLVRGAAVVREDDAARRMLHHLSSVTVQRDRSTDLEQVGVLVSHAFGTADYDFHQGGGDLGSDSPSRAADRLLRRYGMRVVRELDIADSRNRPVPRGGPGDGIWFGARVDTLKKLFRGSAFEGDRWLHVIGRFDSARQVTVGGQRNVRINDAYTGACVWISRGDWEGNDG